VAAFRFAIKNLNQNLRKAKSFFAKYKKNIKSGNSLAKIIKGKRHYKGISKIPIL